MSKSNLIKTASAAILAIVCGLLVFSLYNSLVNPTVGRVMVTAVFPQDTNITVSSISTRNGFSQIIEVIPAKASINGASRRVGTHKINTPIYQLHLKFEASAPSQNKPKEIDKTRRVLIENIQIERAYDTDTLIANNHISNNFFSQREIPNAAPNKLYIDDINQADTLLSKESLNQPVYWKSGVLALIFTLATYVLIRQLSWRNIPAFSDMSLGREISSSHEFMTINGLRGLAAILVLLSHTAPGFHALGVGLAMLLVLSGFLLTKPFILNPNKIFERSNIQLFLVKRLKRILPMYYLYVFITYVVALKMDVALRHFLFVQAEGHLWPMTQILAFYMLLPFILIITCLLYKLNKLIPIIALLIAAYFWWSEMLEWQPFYNGQYSHSFLLHAFLIGVAGSYIQYGLLNNQKIFDFFTRWKTLLSIIGIAVTFFTIAWSAPIRPPVYILQYISQFHIKCLLCILIILLALNTKDTWFAKLISNKVSCAVGIVGFSFYILHGLGMQVVLAAQKQLLAIPNPTDRSWEFMLMVFCITYLLSVVTYSYIERPFFGFRKPATSKP